MHYNFIDIEKKWQQYWQNKNTYSVFEDSDKKKFYVLDMFPYPSGSGLHVGHPLGYIASDVFSRYKRLKGYNVLHPMGYDSFGLPTEQYAILTGIHPEKATEENTNRYRRQLDQLGFSFDWKREIKTSDPNFYKWTQWIFKQLFSSYYCRENDKAMPISNLINIFKKNGNKDLNVACDEDTPSFSCKQWSDYSFNEKQTILLKYRLAFLSDSLVNWCEGLGTVLANDEIKDGVSERGGFPVEQKLMKQWSLRITAYADRLLSGLDKIDWPDSIKEIQKNWIGKSTGASINFLIEDSTDIIQIFTTRPDTIFAVDFLVLAPEHDLTQIIIKKGENTGVGDYINQAKLKSDRDRQSDKKITGVFSGIYAVHPFNGKKIPIWIADYVLSTYGSGAIMGVPCGDQRDWDFANYFNIEITNIFQSIDVSQKAYVDKDKRYINSHFLNGLSYKEANRLILRKIQELGIGSVKTNYRLRDAVFSRQRYWGEPFPVYYKKDVPYIFEGNEYVNLPVIDEYLPTSSGEPPLARAKKENWNIFKGERMETNVMPGWAGSSWYFLRYMDPNNNKEFCSKSKSDYWGPIDLYIGGAEHAVGHLLYSRFWTKFLYDRGYISFDEPFKKLINQGMILGKSSFVYRINNTNTFVTYEKKKNYQTTKIHVDISLVKNNILNINDFRKWRKEYEDSKFILNNNNEYVCGGEVEKMSKSKYNVQSPDTLIEKFGADTLRLYEMFLGPLEQFKPWDTQGINGVHNFLKKFWRLVHNEKNKFFVSDESPTPENFRTLHKTIKKFEEDIERYSFNTVVSAFMICINELTDQQCRSREIISEFTILLYPYAPHISEEIWSKLGNTSSISLATFPKYNSCYLIENEIKYPVSFNGKTRFTITLPTEMTKDSVEEEVLKHEKTTKYLDSRKPKKVIVVPGRIVNIVI